MAPVPAPSVVSYRPLSLNSATAVPGGSLAPTTTYDYVYTAITPFGESVPSNIVSATTSATDLQVNVLFSPLDIANGGYNLYRRVGAGAFQRANASPILTTSFADDGTFVGATLVSAGTDTTVSLPYYANAGQIQTALQNLTTIQSVGGRITVIETGRADAQTATYSVIFNGTFTGKAQPLVTVVTPTVGTTTVSTPAYLIQGGSANATPFQWFNLGPSPITGAQVNNSNGSPTQVETGRVTGIGVQPGFSNDIVISTADGGYWRTQDGGLHWTQMTDYSNDPTFGEAALFGGAVAVVPNRPEMVYFGTGEANNSTDSYYGSGVYLRNQVGLNPATVTLLTDPLLGNPLIGKAINRIVVDPVVNPVTNVNNIYVAVSDHAQNGVISNAGVGNTGVWRYDGVNWVNLTKNQFGSGDISFTDLFFHIGPSVGSTIDDVLWMAVGTVPSIKTGTLSTINGSANVTGIGTHFMSDLAPGSNIFTNYTTVTTGTFVIPPLNAGNFSVPVASLVGMSIGDVLEVFDGTSHIQSTVVGFIGNNIIFTSVNTPANFLYNIFDGIAGTTMLAGAGVHGAQLGTVATINSDTSITLTAGATSTHANIAVLSGNTTKNGVFASSNSNFRGVNPTWTGGSRGTDDFFGSPPWVLGSVNTLSINTVDPVNGGFGNNFQTVGVTYEYEYTAIIAAGETAASPVVVSSGADTAVNRANRVNFSTSPSATGGYNLYRRVAGSAAPFHRVNTLGPIGGAGPTITFVDGLSDVNTLAQPTPQITATVPGYQPPIGNVKISGETNIQDTTPPAVTFNRYIYAAVGNDVGGLLHFMDTHTLIPVPPYDPLTGWEFTSAAAPVSSVINPPLVPPTPATVPATNYDYLGMVTPAMQLGEGMFASAMVSEPTGTGGANGFTGIVYVGGTDATGGQGFIYRSTDNGGTWTDISNIAVFPNSPHSGVHAMILDSANNLLVGTDGGLWRWTKATQTWSNLNGDLSVSSTNSITTKPGDPNTVLASGTRLGSFIFNGSGQTWQSISGLNRPDINTQIQYVPTNANMAFAISKDYYSAAAPQLYRSLDGGVTFNLFRPNVSVFALDPNNPNRVVTGTQQTFDGTNFINLSAPFAATHIALAQFQGPYQADPFFTTITANATNHYDPDTIYLTTGSTAGSSFPSSISTNGSSISVTKNGGLTWTPVAGPNNRTPSFAGSNATAISAIIVDPTNRDIAYVTVDGFVGTAANTVPDKQRVFKTTNAGQTWTDISAGLPDAPAYTLALDPRDNTLYLGGDKGVWVLNGGVGSWQKFGAGLPSVQVRQLELNTANNMLTAATDGRGAWRFYIGDTQANAGALRALAGNNVWNGPVVLNGSTTVSANGSLALQTGLAGSFLTIQGNISDAITPIVTTTSVSFSIPAVGASGPISVGTTAGILAGQNLNISDGTSLITATVLSVDSPTGLTIRTVSIPQISPTGLMGSLATVTTSATPTVTNTTLAFTVPDIADLTPITVASTAGILAGQTVSITDGTDLIFATVNTVNGPTSLTIKTVSIVQGLARSSMAVGASVTTVVNALTKIGGGDVILQGTNTYGGATFVNKGNLVVAQSTALGSSVQGTTVLDGASLELKSNLNLEPVTVFGNGVLPPYNGHYTGALESVVNNNTYTGPLTFNTSTTLGVDAGSLTVIAPVTQNATTSAGVGLLAANVTYYYVVSAVVSATETVASNEQLFIATAGNTAVNLSWNAVAGATGYRIYRSTTSRSYGASSLVATLTGTSFTDTGAATTLGAPARPFSVSGVGFSVDKEGAGTLTFGSANNYGNALTGRGTIVDTGVLGIRDSHALGFVTDTGITTTSTFTIPAVGGSTAAPPSPLAVAVSSIVGLVNGQTLYITDGTHTISAIVTVGPGNFVTLQTSTIHQGLAGDTMGLATIGLANTTIVRDGAQFQIQAGASPIDVSGQVLVLAGTGTSTDGAVFNVSGNNIWSGNIVLSEAPNFSPTSTPAGVVAINLNANSSLKVAGTISQAPPPAQNGAAASIGAPDSGLAQIGLGTLTLAGSNSYTGGTYVGYTFGTTYFPGGIVDLQHNNALGSNQGREIQRLVTFDPPAATDTFTLSFGSGTVAQTTTAAPITTGASAAVVQGLLNAVPNVAAAGGVTVTQTSVLAGLNDVQNISFANATGDFYKPTGLTVTPATGGSLVTGTTYSYVVTALTAAGESVVSTEVNTGPIGAVLRSANLTWTAVPGATGYRVYRTTVPGNYTNARITTLLGNGSTGYLDTGVDLPPTLNAISTLPGGSLALGTYNYVVTAVINGNETVVSNERPITISGPNFTASLSWSPVLNATSYRIYRSTVAGNYINALLTTVTGRTSYNDVGFAVIGRQSPPGSPPAQTSIVLTFNGINSLSFLFTGNAATDRTSVQNAMNSILPVGAQATVTADGSGAGFVITFSGTLSDIPQPLVTANIAGGVASATVINQGGGYIVGQTLTLVGGTFTTAAQFTVTAVGPTGNILAVTVSQAGAYSVLPPSPASVSGAGGATFNLVSTSNATASTTKLAAGVGGVTNIYSIAFNAPPSVGDMPTITVTPNVPSFKAQVTEVATGGIGTLVNAGTTLQIGETLTLASANVVATPGNLTVGATYNYVYTANTPFGETTASNNLAASAVISAGAGQIDVSFMPIGSANGGYNLYRRVGAGAFRRVNAAPILGTTFRDNVADASLLNNAPPSTFAGPGITIAANNILALNGTGFTAAEPGAFINTAGDNAWQGSVVLQSNTTMSARANTELTISGTVQDPTPLPSNLIPSPIPPAILTKVGMGTISLAPASQTIALVNITGSGPVVPNQPANPTPVALGSLTIGTSYFYVVTALTSTGETLRGNERTFLPVLNPSGPNNQTARLTWTAIPGAVGYRIYRTTTAGNYPASSLIATLIGNPTTFDDNGIFPTVGAPPVVTQVSFTFNGNTTASSVSLIANNPAGNAAAISALMNTPAMLGATGTVAVTADATGSIYTFTFGGSLLGTTLPITATVTQGNATQSSSFTGSTYAGSNLIQEGVLDIQQDKALGVNRSAIQDVAVTGTSGTFTLGFASIPDVPALPNAAGGTTAVANGSLALSTPYYYVVTALTPSGETFVSNERIIVATTPGSQAASLSWTANVPGATAYKIYRTLISGIYGAGSLITTTTATSYIDYGTGSAAGPVQAPVVPTAGGSLVIGNRYFYVVSALLPSGESVVSNEQFFDPAGANRTAGLAWAVTPGAIGYKIYRATTGGGYTTESLLAMNIGLANVTFNDTGNPTLASAPGTALLSVGASASIVQNALNALTNINAPLNVAAATESVVNTVTITTGNPHGLTVGQSVAIANVGVDGYNGTYLVTAVPTANTFTYFNPTGSLANSGGGTVNRGTGSVTVIQIGNTYRVYFNNPVGAPDPLAHFAQQPLLAAFTAGASVTVTPIQLGGASTTSVLNPLGVGASLQMENVTGSAGFTESSGKVLTINGLGFNGQGALDNVSGDNRWSTTPIVLGTNSALGSHIAEAPLPAAPVNTLFIDQAITDSNQTQDITFSASFANNDTYTLDFAGYSTSLTSPLVFNGASSAANRTIIQNALNALPGISMLGGSVSVSIIGLRQYRVEFTGAMAGLAWPTIFPGVVNSTGTVTAAVSGSVSHSKSVTKVGVGTVQYSGAIANAYTGVTDIQAGTLQLNKTGVNTAVLGDVNVGTTNLQSEVQQIVLDPVPGFTANVDQFRLTFNGVQTGPILFTGIAATDEPAIKAALEGLSSISAFPGTVTVTETSVGTFSIAFGGGLANRNVPQITAAAVAPALGTFTITTLIQGGSSAPSSDVLQLLQSNQIADGKTVTVNADGLFDLNDQSETIAALSITTGTTTTGTALGGNTLTVAGPLTISSGGTLNLPGVNSTVTVNGATTFTDSFVNLSGAGSRVNTNGLLTASGSVIDLSGDGSKLALGGDLTAASTATGAAVIKGQGTVSLGATRTFTVNHATATPVTSDLLIDSTITDAFAINVQSVPNASGQTGRVELAAQNTYSGTTTVLGGDVQVDSVFQLDFTAFANGDTFHLGYDNGLVAVADATTPISGPIVYTGTIGSTGTDQNIFDALVSLLMSAFGFTAPAASAAVAVHPIASSANSFTIALIGNAGVDLGTVSANITSAASVVATVSATSVKTIGDVTLNRIGATPPVASLSGAGTVGNVGMGAGSGTVNPGNNGTTSKTGALHVVGDVTLNSSSIFAVNLSNLQLPGAPNIGTDYDQLSVSGNVTLGHAILTGVPAGAMQVGDTFTIVHATGAGSVMGFFDTFTYGTRTQINDLDAVFLNGVKFLVDYTPTTVVLTRQTATVSAFDLASSANPSIYGQDVTFSALATVEKGAAFNSAGAHVDFYLDTVLTASPAVDPAKQQITLTGFATGNTFTLTYFNGTQFGTTGSITFNSASAATTRANIQAALDSLLGTTLGFAPGNRATVTTIDTTNFAITFNGGSAVNVYPMLAAFTMGTVRVSTLATYAPQSSIPTVWSPTPPTHQIDATFQNSNSVFTAPVPSANSITQTINKNTVNIGFNSPDVVAGGTIAYGHDINLTATLSPGAPQNLPASVPSGSVTFYVDGVGGPTSFNDGIVAYPNVTRLIPGNLLLTPGAHAIDVTYNGDPNYAATATITTFHFDFTVVADSSTLAFTPAPVNSFLGQNATFNVLVTPGLGAGSPGDPKGVVQFYDGDPAAAGVLLNASTTVSSGAFVMKAPGGGSTTVSVASAVAAGLAIGQNVLITRFGNSMVATITNVAGNSVTFNTLWIVSGIAGNTMAASAVVSRTAPVAARAASFSYPSLSLGSHTIFAVYTPTDANYTGTKNSVANFIVQKATTSTTITVIPAASYGTSATFTVQVAQSPSIAAVFPLLSVVTAPATVTLYAQTAFATNTTASFLIPVIGNTVAVAVPTAGMAVNQYLYISDGTNIIVGQVTVIGGANSATIKTISVNAGLGNFNPPSLTAPGVTMGIASVTGLNNLGNAALGGTGTANITTGPFTLQVGNNIPLLAVYSNSNNFAASQDNTHTVTVTGAKANVSVTTTTANPIAYNSAITLVATVNSGVPTPPATPPAPAGTSFATFWDVMAPSITATSAIFAMPAPTDPPLTISVGTNAGMAVNQLLYIASGPNALIAKITGVGVPSAGTSITIQTLAILTGSAGANMASGAGVSVAKNLGNADVVAVGSSRTATLNIPAGSVNNPPVAFMAGSHSVYASYTDTFDGNYTNGADTPLTNYSVINAPTNVTSLVPTWNPMAQPPVYAEPVTLTATVTSPSGPVTTGAGSFVTFFDMTTNTTLGTGNVGAGGTASLPTSVLTAASHIIRAIYTDTINSFFQTSPAFFSSSFNVNKADTAITAFTSSQNPSVVGQSVTYTATVMTVPPAPNSAAVVTAGTVTFFDNAAPIGSPVTVNAATGMATSAGVTYTTAQAGVHTITAIYNPPVAAPINYNASATATLAGGQTVLKTTNVGLSLSPASPIAFGQTTDLTYTVTGSGGVPTGTVDITDTVGAVTTTLFTSRPLSSSPVTLSGLGVGSHSIKVTYSGDSVFATSNNTIPLTVNAAAVVGTSVSSATGNPVITTNGPTGSSARGAPVTFTVSFKANSGGLPPIGTVTFKDGANPLLGPVSYTGNNGVDTNFYTFTTGSAQLPALGAHTITATYTSGNANFATNITTNFTHTVNAAPTTTSLGVPSPSPSQFGQTVTFSATVAPTVASNSMVTPSGFVNFYDTIGANPAVFLGQTSLNISGVAQFQISTLAVNAGHNITATYVGNANNTTSSSSAQVEAVNPVNTTTTITSSAGGNSATATAGNSVFGQPVTFTINVAIAAASLPAPSAGTPSGTVSLTDSVSGPLATNLTLINGMVSFQTNALSVAGHSITATYSPTTNYAPSNNNAAPLTHNVQAAATTATMTSSSTFWAVNQPVTFTATITATAPSTAIVTGSVIFTVDNVAQPAVALDGTGKAKLLDWVFTTIGNHDVKVSYVASTNFQASPLPAAPVPAPTNPNVVVTAPWQTQNVRNFSAVSLSSSSNPAIVNSRSPLTFYATVTGTGAGTPTGNVNFYDGVSFIGSGTLNASGVATLTITSLAVGTHNITAFYVGDINYNPAVTSAPLKQSVVTRTNKHLT